MRGRATISLNLILVAYLAACSNAGQESRLPASLTPKGSALEPSATMPAVSAPSSSTTPRPTNTPLPRPTADPMIVRYLTGVEALLHHSSVPVLESAQSFADMCPERYIVVFPYWTSRNSMSLVAIGLPRLEDGTVVEGEHKILWEWRDTAVGQLPLTLLNIRFLERSAEWPLMIRFLVQWPGGNWEVGVAYGHCPGDDLELVGQFPIEDPQDLELMVTRYSEEALFDSWIQEGGRLKRWQREGYDAFLLWTLDETPGKLLGVDWNEFSPDLTGDGQPDMVITWEVEGEQIRWVFREDETGFKRVDPLAPQE